MAGASIFRAGWTCLILSLSFATMAAPIRADNTDWVDAAAAQGASVARLMGPKLGAVVAQKGLGPMSFGMSYISDRPMGPREYRAMRRTMLREFCSQKTAGRLLRAGHQIKVRVKHKNRPGSGTLVISMGGCPAGS